MILKTIDIGDPVFLPVDLTRRHQDNAAVGANQEIGGLGAEPVTNGLYFMCNRKLAAWVGQPFDLMLCAERAPALTRSELLQRKFRLNFKSKRAAVA